LCVCDGGLVAPALEHRKEEKKKSLANRYFAPEYN
jgi:hypothetical protein